MANTAMALDVEPVTTNVGAIIRGLDLREPADAATVEAVHQAVLAHGVVFFPGLDITKDQLGAFVENFGTPIAEPATSYSTEPLGESDMGPTRRSTSVWHSDTSFVEEPPGLTFLRAVTLPPVGGDTCWASMYAAYDALSEPFRQMLDGLTALHSAEGTAARIFAAVGRPGVNDTEVVHPVVRVHPDTGRKALYVTECATTRIMELTQAESDRVLGLLFEHVKSPEFMTRWRWQPGDLAFWDNRIVQHYAVPDYEAPRVMQRVVLAGERPLGVDR